jgi:hypothetical protein
LKSLKRAAKIGRERSLPGRRAAFSLNIPGKTNLRRINI